MQDNGWGDEGVSNMSKAHSQSEKTVDSLNNFSQSRDFVPREDV